MAVDRIRGSINIDLNDEGRLMAVGLGKAFKLRGGVDYVVTSTLQRTVQTGYYIGRENEKAEYLGPQSCLQPWHLGMYEGTKTEDSLPKIHDLVKNRPYVKIPGMNEKSTEQGESFNEFKQRVITCFWNLMTDPRFVDKKVVVVTHLRDLRLLDAWLKRHEGKPAKDSFEIEIPAILEQTDEPGTVHRFWKGADNAWRLRPENMDSPADLSKGFFITRHGKTAMNG